MRPIHLITTLMLITLITGCLGNRSGESADYTVRGVSSDYKRQDTRVYVTQPLLEKLQEDGLHDRNSDAIKALQQPHASMANFPADRRGGINWVQAIDEGIVNPRASLQGDEEMTVMDLDIMFEDTGDMPWVRFPHLAHTRWLACSNCHPKIFKPQRGFNDQDNKVNMDAILAGEFCGRCHDKVAFSLWTCERCHSVPQPGQEAWWRENDNPMAATRPLK